MKKKINRSHLKVIGYFRKITDKEKSFRKSLLTLQYLISLMTYKNISASASVSSKLGALPWRRPLSDRLQEFLFFAKPLEVAKAPIFESEKSFYEVRRKYCLTLWASREKLERKIKWDFFLFFFSIWFSSYVNIGEELSVYFSFWTKNVWDIACL